MQPLLNLHGLRREIHHLEKLLELRMHSEQRMELISYILIGFVQKDEDEPSPLCAITWSGLSTVPTDVRILIKQDWQRLLPPEDARYFADLLNDWKQQVQSEPGAVLTMTGRLSVGPIRTMGQGSVHKEEAAMLMYQRLGILTQFPAAFSCN